jgi:hypothetical protein
LCRDSEAGAAISLEGPLWSRATSVDEAEGTGTGTRGWHQLTKMGPHVKDSARIPKKG